MKKRVRLPFVGILILLAFAALPVAAQHTACNCWDGGWICTTEDDNHNVVWYLSVENSTNC